MLDSLINLLIDCFVDCLIDTLFDSLMNFVHTTLRAKDTMTADDSISDYLMH